MEQYDLWKLDKKLQKEVDEDRYHHTLGVMFTAASMAMVWGEDLEKARVAGLLHDCAKCIPNKKKITMCEKNKIEITEFERNNPFLIHAKLGAFLAKDKYKVEDPEILSAITWHTTGKEDMTLLEKIIYIADYIEPARNKAPHLTRLRKLAFTDIDECMYEILKDSMAYLSENPKTMDPMTEQAYQFYEALHRERTAKEEAKQTANLALEALEDKKAMDVRILDITHVSTLADYFMIASGSNRNQVQAMADNVEEVLGKAGVHPKQIEGYQTANWILMDYGDVVIHIFDEENRLFYDLERIWRDGKVVEKEEIM